MVVALANARMTVPAPTRTARRFGLLSAVEVVDGGSPHWMLGGLQADSEECSKPLDGAIGCGPSAPKTADSWFSTVTGDPWMTYMFENCRTVGRWGEASGKLRTRFLASEMSAVERGFQQKVLTAATDVGDLDTVPHAIGYLEAHAAMEYGGQIVLHLPFVAAEEAASKGVFERVGDHLETVAGNVVSIGNYTTNGSVTAPGPPITTSLIYATGATTLYRSELVESGPTLGMGAGNVPNNDYFTLIERAYAALVDCYMTSVTATLCGC